MACHIQVECTADGREASEGRRHALEIRHGVHVERAVDRCERRERPRNALQNGVAVDIPRMAAI